MEASVTPCPSVRLESSRLILRVISRDSRLLAVCQEALRDLDETLPRSGLPPAYVCVWDFGAQDPLPELLEDENVLYVVPPGQLEQLRTRFPEVDGSILLKPVTRQVLLAFLSSSSGLDQEIGTLRTNRDEILQHLLQANLRLQEYDQQRTNFIARAVHDFRAPLTAMSGFCGLLAEGELGPLNERQREALQRMLHSVKRLSRMASAMFDLSTGPRLARKPDLRPGDILEPVRQAVHEVTPALREKHITLRMEQLEAPPEALYFEQSQIEQVLVNLLENACRFVPKHGWIELSGYPYFWERRRLAAGVERDRRRHQRPEPNSFRLDVRDNGPGVSQHLLEHIFEEYTSYSGSRDRSGGGLGLAICRLIIHGHGGQIWAESTGAGTTFSFVLPLSPTPPEAAPRVPVYREPLL